MERLAAAWRWGEAAVRALVREVPLAPVAAPFHAVHTKALADHLFAGHPRTKAAVGVLKHDLHIAAQPTQFARAPVRDILA